MSKMLFETKMLFARLPTYHSEGHQLKRLCPHSCPTNLSTNLLSLLKLVHRVILKGPTLLVFQCLYSPKHFLFTDSQSLEYSLFLEKFALLYVFHFFINTHTWLWEKSSQSTLNFLT